MIVLKNITLYTLEEFKMDTKTCCKCKIALPLTNFGKLKASKDGHRYDCKGCRKQYRDDNKVHIKAKNSKYYAANKEQLNNANRERQIVNRDRYNEQRKEYRSRDDVKAHIAQKNKEYLPIKKAKIKEKRKTDLTFQLSEILRSKIHKMLAGKKTSYESYIGCNIQWLKKWLEYRFDSLMRWDNLGTYWQIDHVLPICQFDFSKELDKHVCFHWTNLQPLPKNDNRAKSGTIFQHMFFNNMISVIRFNTKYKQYLGYQNIRESLCWLREKLRYGKNPTYEAKAENGRSAAKLLKS